MHIMKIAFGFLISLSFQVVLNFPAQILNRILQLSFENNTLFTFVSSSISAKQLEKFYYVQTDIFAKLLNDLAKAFFITFVMLSEIIFENLICTSI